eukprot:JP435805.1.p1 GENE.JP435805.1~~JP435805.1.p1  ORF type:complete len:299 (+),score=43.75 JP435805.1:1-897(+)
MDYQNSSTNNMLHQLSLDNVSPATRLLEKRRQMFEVQEALETQKEEFARSEELFKRREDSLREKDLELQECLIRFNKFLQENDSKRTRAEKKAAEEVKQRIQKESEIEELKEQLESLIQQRETTKTILDKNTFFQQYLEIVIDNTEDHSEINDLLQRHLTLMGTYNDLKESSSFNVESADRQRTELQNTAKASQDMRLRKHNNITNLQVELEEKEANTRRQMQAMEEQQEQTKNQRLELGRIRMAIDNLYLRCKARASISLPDRKEPVDQLKVIGDYMMDLNTITKQFKSEKSTLPKK